MFYFALTARNHHHALAICCDLFYPFIGILFGLSPFLQLLWLVLEMGTDEFLDVIAGLDNFIACVIFYKVIFELPLVVPYFLTFTASTFPFFIFIENLFIYLLRLMYLFFMSLHHPVMVKGPRAVLARYSFILFSTSTWFSFSHWLLRFLIRLISILAFLCAFFHCLWAFLNFCLFRLLTRCLLGNDFIQHLIWTMTLTFKIIR